MHFAAASEGKKFIKPKWEVIEVPDKGGLGVVATDTIQPGSVSVLNLK